MIHGDIIYHTKVSNLNMIMQISSTEPDDEFQSAFIKGRHIHNNMRYWICQTTNLKVTFYSLTFSKLSRLTCERPGPIVRRQRHDILQTQMGRLFTSCKFSSWVQLNHPSQKVPKLQLLVDFTLGHSAAFYSLHLWVLPKTQVQNKRFSQAVTKFPW